MWIKQLDIKEIRIRAAHPRYMLTVTPWEGWTEKEGPDWWENGYNKIKHERLKHPGAPSMIRAINAVGALQAVLLYLYRTKHGHCAIAIDIAPRLIEPLEDEFGGSSLVWGWQLPDDSLNGD